MRLASALLVTLVAVALVSAASGQAVPGGSYTVLDGPKAGQNVSVHNGHGSLFDQTADLTVVPAGNGCDEPHVTGTINGKQAPAGPCGWGRIRLISEVGPVIRTTANAITEEERAVAFLAEPVKPHWELVLYGKLGVEHALEAVDAAEASGDLTEAQAKKIRSRLNAAHAIDEKLQGAMQATQTTPSAAQVKSWSHDLQNALNLKREAFAVEQVLLPQPVGACTAEKPFQVYAIPDGYQGSYAEVYPHGIPRNAKNISVTFVDADTGKPVPAEVFPGQTWTSEIKGFKPDGRLIVRVNLTGTGFGKPDANHKSWKVIVHFDCP